MTEHEKFEIACSNVGWAHISLLFNGERYVDNAIDNMWWAWQAATKAAAPDGWKLVPVEPTGEQCGGLARDIIFWLRSDSHQTPESLIEFLRNMGNEIPSWLTDEPEMKNANHVISKGTLAAIIYKAMLSAVPEVK